MLPSAMSSSMVGALLIHSPSRWESTRQPSAMTCRSDVADAIGNLVEGRGPVDLVQRRGEQRPLFGGVTFDDLRRRHDPDRHTLATAGVDVARVLHCHLGVDRVHTADM